MSRPLRGVFVGKVVDQKFLCDKLNRMKQVMDARNGLATRIEIGPVPRNRSDPQLAYYWAGIIREIHLWSGQPEDQIHDHLKEKVLRPMLHRKLYLPLPNGKHLVGIPSTGLLTVDDMNHYIYLCKEYVQQEWPEVILPDIDHGP